MSKKVKRENKIKDISVGKYFEHKGKRYQKIAGKARRWHATNNARNVDTNEEVDLLDDFLVLLLLVDALGVYNYEMVEDDLESLEAQYDDNVVVVPEPAPETVVEVEKVEVVEITPVTEPEVVSKPFWEEVEPWEKVEPSSDSDSGGGSDSDSNND